MVPDPTPAEIAAVQGFFGKQPRLDKQQRLCLPLAEFDAQLRRTRFACSLLELLDAYFGLPATRHEEATQQEESWEAFLAEVEAWVEARKGSATSDWARRWWTSVLEEESNAHENTPRVGSRGLLRQHHAACADDASGLLDEVKKVTAALERLPLKQTRLIRLPVFATEICGDPHAFDVAQLAGRLLERAIAALHPDPGDLLDGVFSATLRRDLLLAWAGLQRDDLSSTVLVANLYGNPTLKSLSRVNAAVALPLREVERLGRIVSRTRHAYVVENPSVFGTLLEEVERQLPTRRRPALVCPSGQPSMAAILLLDKLSTTAHLHYSGDFDGAGIGITSNLMRRYGARLTPWRMSATDYRNATTRHAPCPSLDARDITQLEQSERALPELTEALLQRGVKGYQEALLPLLCADITAGTPR
jgi:uncharacterized protein (TIGR02679 family)